MTSRHLLPFARLVGLVAVIVVLAVPARPGRTPLATSP